MKKTILPLLILHLICFGLYSQNDSTAIASLKQFVTNIQSFNHLIPQEKVYLHFDNNGYELGETIWFKAYVQNAVRLEPVSSSGVLYVELLNSKGKILETKKIKIEDGESHGEFYLNNLDVEYFPGFYEVRAYTKAMLNFGDNVIFSRVFPVFDQIGEDRNYKKGDLNDNLDIDLPNKRKDKNKNATVNVDFYPEGGNLVEGLTSRVAFKVTGKEGQALNVQGKILDPSGKVLEKISTQHNGMGVFSYTPDKKKNIAKVSFENKDYSFELPVCSSKGYVMTVNNFSNKSLILQIEKAGSFPENLLGLTIMNKGDVSYFQALNIKESSYKVKIPKEILSSGVNQLTLFDKKGEVFAERLFFIFPENNENAVIEVGNNNKIYEPLELISLNFSLKDKNVAPNSSFSLSIKDKEMNAGSVNNDNIASYFLLSSDLQGYIENPGYYFEKKDASRLTALDLLMMVQGWKRYEWQTMAGVKPFNAKFNYEKNLTIKGFLASSSKKDKEVKIHMQNDKREVMDGTTITDNEGSFYFYPEDYYGEWDVSLICGGISDGAKNIRIDRWFSPDPKKYIQPQMKWSSNRVPLGKRNADLTSKGMYVENTDNLAYRFPDISVNRKRTKYQNFNVGDDIDYLIDKGKKIPDDVDHYLSFKNDYYRYPVSYTVGDRSSALDMNSDMNNPYIFPMNTPSVKIENYGNMNIVNDDSFSPTDYREDIRVYDLLRLSGVGDFSWKPSYFAVFFHLDGGTWNINSHKVLRLGKHFSDVRVQYLTSRRNIKEVKKISVAENFKSDDYARPYTPIYIYPYENFGMRILPGTRYTTFQGFSKPKDFFGNRINKEDNLPESSDYQRTLYWNPTVKLDESGKASVKFYNNLTCRSIEISAEGISANGKPMLYKE